jgi:hypothetical protein
VAINSYHVDAFHLGILLHLYNGTDNGFTIPHRRARGFSVAVTALILSVALPVYFLTMVAVFSFYSAFAAYRVLYLKDMYKGARPKAVDWVAAVVTVLSSLLLFLLGFCGRSWCTWVWSG